MSAIPPPTETIVELNYLSTYALADGTYAPVTLGDGSLWCQRTLIVDNLNRASPESPITITGNLSVGSSFTFNIPGQALEPFWNGTVWVCA